MRFYCTDCGRYFDDEEADYRQECVGEFWGTPAYETFMMCPHCRSEEWIDEDDVDFPEEEDEDGNI